MDDDIDDDEYEPLECVPHLVAIEAYDVEVGGPSTVRLFFEAASQQPWPGGDLSDVVVLDDWERVSIALVRRSIEGDAPDGTSYGGRLLIRFPQVSLDVQLRDPLGTRTLIDASTGETVPRVERTSADPLPAEAMGTPRWIPA
jgi:hypothetical protein